MAPEKISIKAGLKVMRSPQEVFETIVDPDQMSNYFIETSTGRMEAGKTVTWKFPEFDMRFPVHVEKTDPGKFISFYWDGASDGQDTLVEMKLRALDSGCFIEITEKEKKNDEAGIKWLKSNTEGWANFLACLKAFMEFGINLRKNAYDSSQLPTKDIMV